MPRVLREGQQQVNSVSAENLHRDGLQQVTPLVELVDVLVRQLVAHLLRRTGSDGRADFR